MDCKAGNRHVLLVFFTPTFFNLNTPFWFLFLDLSFRPLGPLGSPDSTSDPGFRLPMSIGVSSGSSSLSLKR